MKVGIAAARNWQVLLVVFNSAVVTGGFVYLTAGLERTLAFTGCAGLFWLIHAAWQRQIDHHSFRSQEFSRDG